MASSLKISEKKTAQASLEIPTSVFCNRKLSFLESLVVYLKEYLKLSYKQIADLTNRDQRNIWTLYSRAVKKIRKADFTVSETTAYFPLSVVKDRSLGILEVVVEYLIDQALFTNHQAAMLLNRSDKTIWTAHHRAKQKRNENKK